MIHLRLQQCSLAFSHNSVAKLQLLCYPYLAGTGNGMSQIEKLKTRLLNKPKDFTIEELERLLFGLGYIRGKQGKTVGSKIEYLDPSSGKHLVFHSPHPQKELKAYAIQKVIQFLEETERV